MVMDVVQKKSENRCWFIKRDEMNLVQKRIFKNDGNYVEVRACGNILLDYVKAHHLVWYINTTQERDLFVYPKDANACEGEPSNIDSDGNGHGYVIVFLCNNKKCLNPNHLYCEDRLVKRDNCHTLKNNKVCIHTPKCLVKRNVKSLGNENENENDSDEENKLKKKKKKEDTK